MRNNADRFPRPLGGPEARQKRFAETRSQPEGVPAETQRSGFGGERRSKGANAVFAVRRKRR